MCILVTSMCLFYFFKANFLWHTMSNSSWIFMSNILRNFFTNFPDYFSSLVSTKGIQILSSLMFLSLVIIQTGKQLSALFPLPGLQISTWWMFDLKCINGLLESRLYIYKRQHSPLKNSVYSCWTVLQALGLSLSSLYCQPH